MKGSGEAKSDGFDGRDDQQGGIVLKASGTKLGDAGEYIVVCGPRGASAVVFGNRGEVVFPNSSPPGAEASVIPSVKSKRRSPVVRAIMESSYFQSGNMPSTAPPFG